MISIIIWIASHLNLSSIWLVLILFVILGTVFSQSMIVSILTIVSVQEVKAQDDDAAPICDIDARVCSPENTFDSGCSDGVDNDRDGEIDLEDQDCVSDENHVPIADDKDVKTDMNNRLRIPLTASDEDEETLTLFIDDYPERGDIDVNRETSEVNDDDNVVTYIPEDGFFGDDSFTYYAKDGKAVSNIAKVSIEVNEPESSPDNERPIASAGPDQTVESGEEVSLDGTESKDPDCSQIIEDSNSVCELTYEWEQVSDESMSIEDFSERTDSKPEFAAPPVNTPVVLTFQLTVNDGIDDSDPDTIDITVEPIVEPPNDRPPIANAGSDVNLSPGKFVQLDGTKSHDPDGNPIRSYEWEQISGPVIALTEAYTPFPTFTAPSVSTHTVLTFQLVVNDGTSDSNPSTVNIALETSEPPDPTLLIIILLVIGAIAVGVGAYAVKHKHSKKSLTSHIEVMTEGGVEEY
jgi:hypothetical protein